MAKLTVKTTEKDYSLDIQEGGLTILDISENEGFPLEHECYGSARCSTCRVIVESGGENLSVIEDPEQDRLDAEGLEEPYRLGCQAKVTGDGEVVIRIPEKDEEREKTSMYLTPSKSGSKLK